ncbi:MAG: TolC family protein [Acidobacteriota bacterium]|nr:TolC family protein [Acidobacteriota bacterium]
MKRTRLLCLTVLLLVPAFLASAQTAVPLPGASAAPVLTLRQAVDAALEHNPSQKLAAAGLREAQAGVHLSRSGLLPQISLSEGLTRGDDAVFAFGAKLRQQVFGSADFSLPSLNHPAPISDFATTLGGRWTVFDGWSTQLQIKRANLLHRSAESSASRTAQEVIFRTVAAYEAVLIATRQAEVARHASETARALHDLAKQRVAAGLAVDSDELSAQVNLAQRQQELIRAEGSVQSAWAELEAAVGTPLPMGPPSVGPLREQSFAVAGVDAEVAVALAQRPDLDSLARQSAAQQTAVRAARSEFSPRVDTFGSWAADRHSFGGAGGSNWMAGAELRVDLLPLQKRAQLEEQKARLMRLEASGEAARSTVRVEVSRAYFAQRSAAKSMEVARDAMAQAAGSERILRNRYDAGLVTLTEVLRAEDAGRQSQSSYWQSVYDNTLSYAALRLATGTLTADEVKNLQ